ncbi:sensor histidine kinase [Sphingorhabdus lutea]|uniref:Sensor histidine kinase n=1 Tax=Sphingorhabdus lutea TaxID=1913578 RepID=A0A1L3JET9_9SPHN|nr:sensor histidine kinase [Sphingorhabdus lutea]
MEKRTSNRPLVDNKLALLTIIGFWLFYALIVSLRSAVMDFPQQGELAMRRFTVTAVGIILTWMLYLFLRLFDRKAINERISAAFIGAIPCAILIAVFNYWVFNIYDPVSLFDDPQKYQELTKKARELFGVTKGQEIAEIAISRYFFIISWALMFIALSYSKEVRLAERRISRLAQAAKDSELRSLRYQVNPHFLFNTLNSLSALVMRGDKQSAEAMIMNLSTFYRHSLSNDPLDEVPLGEEVELQKLYLAIEKVRYPDRLICHFDIEDGLIDLRVPGLILQPLIENAIKYGVSNTRRPVTISVRAFTDNGFAKIIISDDGEQQPAHQNDEQKRQSNGIGLANVRDRLEVRFGPDANMTYGPMENGGYQVILSIALYKNNLLPN